MQSSPTSPPFIPSNTTRGLSSSIWAPQPKQSPSTWPKTIDSFAREAAHIGGNNWRSQFHSRTFSTIDERPEDEDVFGPVGFNTSGGSDAPRRQVGAIGDGRRVKNVSENENDHVQQLLRSLNLHSPAHHSPLSLNIGNTSPDLSPSTVSSALLTPVDASPAHPMSVGPFDVKVPGPDNEPSFQFSQHHRFPTEPDPLNGSVSIWPDVSNLHPSSVMDFPLARRQRFPTSPASSFPSFESMPPRPSPSPVITRAHVFPQDSTPPLHYSSPWPQTSTAWVPMPPQERRTSDFSYGHGLGLSLDDIPSPLQLQFGDSPQPTTQTHEPINFLSLLHPSSSPPYSLFVARIIKASDQQASIFLQQKLKVADIQERAKIVDAICSRGFEMMSHRFGNWAVQRCLEAASTAEERRKIVGCMRGHIVDLATNCYGCHVLQKALDCEEEIRLQIVSELLVSDPAQTLVNKHASHVWSKIMELSWTPPAPPIFAYVNKSLKGKWASLACHETGSLVVQHAFENLEEEAKDGIINELLDNGPAVFGEVAKNQWGSYCIQHILEHGSEKHRMMAVDLLVADLLDYATHEQGAKSVAKALKECDKNTGSGAGIIKKFVNRMCEPANPKALIVDLALSATGSQLIANVLPNADKDQRVQLYEAIRGHIVTLRGCKTGSKVIWLFDRMRAYYGY